MLELSKEMKEKWDSLTLSEKDKLEAWLTEEAVLELKYLRHFHAEADFGQTHEDVAMIINESYEGEIPNGY